MISEAIRIAFIDMIQLYHNLTTEMKKVIDSIIDAIQTSIGSKSYIAALPSLQRLRGLQVFNLIPEINGSEATLRLQTLFFKSIISDCDEAKLAIDNNISGSVETYNYILHQVLAVGALTNFNEEIGEVVAAQESLIAHIGLACDRTTEEFQTMFAERDAGIYSKTIGMVATIDLLRSHKLVLYETLGNYQFLTDAIKISIEFYSKEAIRLIGELVAITATEIFAEAKSVKSLKYLLILINDASTFQGTLQSVYTVEHENVMSEMYRMIKVLSDHAGKGENGIKISFRSHSNLKSLHVKRNVICSLRQIIVDCVDSVPVLVKLPSMMTTALNKCDTAVAKAAMEGISEFISYLILCSTIDCLLWRINLF